MRHSTPTIPVWQRFEIRRIEDLQNAFLGASLDVVQMAGSPVRGSLAFAARHGVVLSTGLIHGRISVRGVSSREGLTLGLGLRFGLGSRLWLNPVLAGQACLLQPGQHCDALFAGASLYVAVSLSAEKLEREAARAGLELDRDVMRHSGLHGRPLARQALIGLRGRIARIHRHAGLQDEAVGRDLLQALLEHYARHPDDAACRLEPSARGRVVQLAREFIHAHLDGPLALEDIVRAAGTSRRTLARAFGEVLQDTPASYVRRLRLHAIRRELMRGATAGRTISQIAAAWGMGEAGRMAGTYHELFGEYPHDTQFRQAFRSRVTPFM